MANANKQLELHLEDPSSARKFILTDWDVSPLHSDLLDDFIIKKPTHITLINFEISGKKHVHETMSMNFQPLCQNDTFALIDGGWAPPSLAIKRAHIIIDRNVINEIKFRFDNGSIKPSRDDDSIVCLAGDTTYKFNLLYFALESNERQIPSKSKITEQLSEARGVIESKLPDASFAYDAASEIHLAEKLLDFYSEITEKRQSFLQEIRCHLSRNTPQKNRKNTWETICAEAKKLRLETNDIAVICALGAATADQKFNPGKSIIKPSPDYTPSAAYNAVRDIQMIELLMNFQIHEPGIKHMILTKDKNLAKFYSLLKNNFYKKTNNGTIKTDGNMLAKFFIKDNGALKDEDKQDLYYLNNLLQS